MTDRVKGARVVLRAVRSLLEDEERWTQGAIARDSEGIPCEGDSSRAVSFCLTGAMNRVCGSTDEAWGSGEMARDAVWDVVDSVNGYSPAAVNDHHEMTHADLLWVLDIALSILDKK